MSRADKKTPELREKYAARFKHDTDAIFEDIRNRQKKFERKCVTLQPRKPQLKRNIAWFMKYPGYRYG